MHCEAYHLPETIEEAVQLLAQYGGRARVVGGGTDYFVDEPRGGSPDALVDVTRIHSLKSIRDEDGYVVIGCGATHTQIVASPLVQRHGMALAEACGQIGGPQVRNVATLAGNIAHALPAADGTLALLALDGDVLIASTTGASFQNPKSEIVNQLWLPLSQAFKGPGLSAIDSTRQVLAAARFRPTEPGEGSAFARVMRPQGVALPIMGLAARVRILDGAIARASIALGPVAPTPFRAGQTEAFLAGKSPTQSAIEQAIEILMAEVSPRTSAHRATADYRREIIPVLFRQAMQAALDRAALP